MSSSPLPCSFIIALCLLTATAGAQKQGGRGPGAAAGGVGGKWQTLTGKAPLVVARGGYSGVFPESSGLANDVAMSTSLPGTAILCDLQLTKDAAAICHSNLQLDNSTTIASVFPKGQKTYPVNGADVRGWFSVDYTADQLLANVSLVQSIFTRPTTFDGLDPVPVLDDVAGATKSLWINVQYPGFFQQHKLDVTGYVLAAAGDGLPIDFVSSPEVGFLRSLNGKIRKKGAGPPTKLVFKFMELDIQEPSTKQTYGSLLKDLSAIKEFASAIIVPKTFIWPVGKDQYLLPSTSLVKDAHAAGLQVYASGFANDSPGSYNYTYDPTAEYLKFVDNGAFAVDGVVSDFPSTASEAIGCLAHVDKNAKPAVPAVPLVISHNGASGSLPGCTDVAYQKAVEDGVDVLDCSVQMSSDGIAFCLNSADVSGATNAMAMFMAKAATVPEVQEKSGVFSFDLTWNEIQTLKPAITSPFTSYGLSRNPAMKNQGKLVTLPDFLTFARVKAVPGVLINIQNAAYLASKKGLGIVDAVSSALKNSSLKGDVVYIQSDDTSVLSAFKPEASYKRVLLINEKVGDAPKPAVDEIKKYADAVNLPKSSVIANNKAGFLQKFTGVVDELRAAKIAVYASTFNNEYVSIAFDCFSDPIIDLATYMDAGLDGVVTEFPGTAKSYIRSPCFDPNAKLPYTISPARPGGLVEAAPKEALPPAEAPAPALKPADVVDPPLPPVVKMAQDAPPADSGTPAGDSSPPPSAQPSGQDTLLPISTALTFVVAAFSLMCLHRS